MLRRTARALGLVELGYEPQESWLRRRGAAVPPPDARSHADWRLAGLLEGRLSFRVLVHERRDPV